ncbi:hypothetical protein V5799_024593 [Amblyomma americanum]|uniref:Uncharacterized protein n=1 Tax=Amblyomma americanum TaxID=6943 RepID=A0AAQ4EC37_AMBAM
MAQQRNAVVVDSAGHKSDASTDPLRREHRWPISLSNVSSSSFHHGNCILTALPFSDRCHPTDGNEPKGSIPAYLACLDSAWHNSGTPSSWTRRGIKATHPPISLRREPRWPISFSNVPSSSFHHGNCILTALPFGDRCHPTDGNEPKGSIPAYLACLDSAWHNSGTPSSWTRRDIKATHPPISLRREHRWPISFSNVPSSSFLHGNCILTALLFSDRCHPTDGNEPKGSIPAYLACLDSAWHNSGTSSSWTRRDIKATHPPILFGGREHRWPISLSNVPSSSFHHGNCILTALPFGDRCHPTDGNEPKGSIPAYLACLDSAWHNSGTPSSWTRRDIKATHPPISLRREHRWPISFSNVPSSSFLHGNCILTALPFSDRCHPTDGNEPKGSIPAYLACLDSAWHNSGTPSSWTRRDIKATHPPISLRREHRWPISFSNVPSSSFLHGNCILTALPFSDRCHPTDGNEPKGSIPAYLACLDSAWHNSGTPSSWTRRDIKATHPPISLRREHRWPISFSNVPSSSFLHGNCILTALPFGDRCHPTDGNEPKGSIPAYLACLDSAWHNSGTPSSWTRRDIKATHPPISLRREHRWPISFSNVPSSSFLHGNCILTALPFSDRCHPTDGNEPKGSIPAYLACLDSAWHNSGTPSSWTRRDIKATHPPISLRREHRWPISFSNVPSSSFLHGNCILTALPFGDRCHPTDGNEPKGSIPAYLACLDIAWHNSGTPSSWTRRDIKATHPPISLRREHRWPISFSNVPSSSFLHGNCILTALPFGDRCHPTDGNEPKGSIPAYLACLDSAWHNSGTPSSWTRRDIKATHPPILFGGREHRWPISLSNVPSSSFHHGNCILTALPFSDRCHPTDGNEPKGSIPAYLACLDSAWHNSGTPSSWTRRDIKATHPPISLRREHRWPISFSNVPSSSFHHGNCILTALPFSDRCHPTDGNEPKGSIPAYLACLDSAWHNSGTPSSWTRRDIKATHRPILFGGREHRWPISLSNVPSSSFHHGNCILTALPFSDRCHPTDGNEPKGSIPAYLACLDSAWHNSGTSSSWTRRDIKATHPPISLRREHRWPISFSNVPSSSFLHGNCILTALPFSDRCHPTDGNEPKGSIPAYLACLDSAWHNSGTPSSWTRRDIKATHPPISLRREHRWPISLSNVPSSSFHHGNCILTALPFGDRCHPTDGNEPKGSIPAYLACLDSAWHNSGTSSSWTRRDIKATHPPILFGGREHRWPISLSNVPSSSFHHGNCILTALPFSDRCHPTDGNEPKGSIPAYLACLDSAWHNSGTPSSWTRRDIKATHPPISLRREHRWPISFSNVPSSSFLHGNCILTALPFSDRCHPTDGNEPKGSIPAYLACLDSAWHNSGTPSSWTRRDIKATHPPISLRREHRWPISLSNVPSSSFHHGNCILTALPFSDRCHPTDGNEPKGSIPAYLACLDSAWHNSGTSSSWTRRDIKATHPPILFGGREHRWPISLSNVPSSSFHHGNCILTALPFSDRCHPTDGNEPKGSIPAYLACLDSAWHNSGTPSSWTRRDIKATHRPILFGGREHRWPISLSNVPSSSFLHGNCILTALPFSDRCHPTDGNEPKGSIPAYLACLDSAWHNSGTPSSWTRRDIKATHPPISLRREHRWPISLSNVPSSSFHHGNCILTALPFSDRCHPTDGNEPKGSIPAYLACLDSAWHNSGTPSSWTRRDIKATHPPILFGGREHRWPISLSNVPSSSFHHGNCILTALPFSDRCHPTDGNEPKGSIPAYLACLDSAWHNSGTPSSWTRRDIKATHPPISLRREHRWPISFSNVPSSSFHHGNCILTAPPFSDRCHPTDGNEPKGSIPAYLACLDSAWHNTGTPSSWTRRDIKATHRPILFAAGIAGSYISAMFLFQASITATASSLLFPSVIARMAQQRNAIVVDSAGHKSDASTDPLRREHRWPISLSNVPSSSFHHGNCILTALPFSDRCHPTDGNEPKGSTTRLSGLSGQRMAQQRNAIVVDSAGHKSDASTDPLRREHRWPISLSNVPSSSFLHGNCILTALPFSDRCHPTDGNEPKGSIPAYLACLDSAWHNSGTPSSWTRRDIKATHRPILFAASIAGPYLLATFLLQASFTATASSLLFPSVIAVTRQMAMNQKVRYPLIWPVWTAHGTTAERHRRGLGGT